MSLVSWFRGDGRREGKMPDGTYIGHEAPTAVPLPGGYEIDGEVWRLEGQPPKAQGGTWGDLSWLRQRYY